MTKRRDSWTEQEDNILKRYYTKFSCREISEKFLSTRTPKAVSSRATKLGLGKRRASIPRFTPELYDPAENLGELWEKLMEFQGVARKFDTHMEEQGAVIDTTEPIILGFLADAHMGAWTGRYNAIEERVSLIEDTDRFYLVSLGDTIDNYLPNKHSQGMFSHIVPPELQKQLVEFLFGRLKGRWLAVVQGCHDEWSHDVDDFDWSRYLALKLGCPNMGFGGFLNLKVGAQPYRVALRHRFRYNSSFNLTHTVKRMREHLGDFDIGAIAHHHQADIEQVAMHDKDRIFIRPGSFKGGDRYSRRLGYLECGAHIPSVILYPDERVMLPFLNLEHATRVLAAL